jgi:hypothetical protein
MTTAKEKRPAVLFIAEEVREEKSAGQYDDTRSTWSNREYALASAKKHNEAM